MNPLAYYSGKIQTAGRVQTGERLDLLPQINTLAVRNDPVFISILLAVILSLLFLGVSKTKIFGKTLAEYIRPIWYFILVSLAVVAWQYLFGLKIENASLPLRISQWIWELMVLASVYKLSKQGFGYTNIFFTGVLYSLFIHGTKVSVRYFFYTKSFLYVLDRFLYGSLLIMAVTALGFVFVYLKRKPHNPAGKFF